MTTVVLNTTTRKVEVFSSARDVQARAYGHDSKPALEAATVPAGISQLFLRGYAEAGDGGAANYKRVASEPGHAGKIQSADGAWWEIAERLYTFKQFGATGDGTTDDTTAINNAVSAAATTGVGRVHGPAGTYIVSAAIIGQSGVHIFGDGIGATIIKREASTAAMQMVSFSGVSNFSIRDMTLDGNRANVATDGHNIRIAEDCDTFYLGNLHLLDAYSYGIGITGTLGNKRGIFESIQIEGSGADCIDIKNGSEVNEALTFNNLVLIDPGMIKVDQAAFDTRSAVQVSNITVLIRNLPNAPVHGVRLRFTTPDAGARHCELTNAYVRNDAVLAGDSHGFSIGGRGNVITGGRVINMTRAVFTPPGFDAIRNKFIGITAENCTHGFSDSSEDNEWIGCNAYGCAGDGFRMISSTRAKIIGGESVGNDRGINGTSATDLIHIGLRCASNPSGDFGGIPASGHSVASLGLTAALPLANGSGVKQAELGTTASPVNFMRVAGGATGSSPEMSAQGSDTDIDLALTPKGTGKVRFGAHAAIGAETVTGYVEIKDSGGTVRKVAVVS